MEVMILKNAEDVATTGAESVAELQRLTRKATEHSWIESFLTAWLKNRDYHEWTYLQNESLKHRFGIVHEG